MPTKTTVRNRINRDLPAGDYFTDVPMDEMFEACKAHGGTPVAEDGTEWSGFLCGEQGRATIVVKFENYTDMYLHISWYKMPSGRWEVIKYVS